MKEKLDNLLSEIRQCRICEDYLPLGPNPVVVANKSARVLIIGQAPGTKVHESGIPWNDPSGDKLREWLQIDRTTFYDEKKIAIVPMGFCYPGRGKSGDLPPRPECAPKWHDVILKELPNVKIIILAGSYAINYYLGKGKSKSISERIREYDIVANEFIPLVHPSPRNRLWLRNNEWFEKDYIPNVAKRVSDLLI